MPGGIEGHRSLLYKSPPGEPSQGMRTKFDFLFGSEAKEPGNPGTLSNSNGREHHIKRNGPGLMATLEFLQLTRARQGKSKLLK